MLVEYCAHSCFAFTDRQGRRVLIDPYDPAIGYRLPLRPADITLVSHDHFDHNHLPAVRGRTTVLRGAGLHQVQGLSFRGVLAPHDDAGGARRGFVVCFAWEMDGLRIAHLGDLGDEVTPAMKEALGPVDLLLVPCGGGGWTLDAAGAARAVTALAPRWVLPMHYRTPSTNRQAIAGLDPVQPFLDRCPRARRLSGSTVELTPDTEGRGEVLLLPHQF
jgi:L-ascorbate metabolism protein UlaG (beta-lactamase superfamily)